MPNAADVIVKFIADTSNLKAGLNDAERSTSGVTKAVKGVGAAITGAFVATEVKSWITAAEGAEAVSAKLAKTLKNAGDESGKWADNAEKLATSLSKQTGIDDDVIKGGQTVLATFHAISGEVGQTSGVFDQATKAAVDLSATGFGTVESASVMLGKALQDPIKGISALGKAGVGFTEQQKEQIKTLVESGNVLKAQKIILGEVEAQVGGVAEKSATGSMKMSVAFNELKESLGAALLPTFTKVAEVAGMVATAFSALPAPVQQFLVVIGLAATAVALLYSSGVNVVKGLGAIFGAIEKLSYILPEYIVKIAALNAAQLGWIGLGILVVGAVVGLVLALGSQASAHEEAAAKGKKWAEQQVENSRQATSTAQALDTLIPKMASVTTELEILRDAQDAALVISQEQTMQYGSWSVQAKEAGQKVYDLGVQISGLEAKQKTLGPEIAKLRHEQELASQAEAFRIQELNALATASQGVATANEIQLKSVNSLNSAYMAAAGGALGYEASQLQVEQAQARLDKLIQDGSLPTSLEYREAQNSLAQAQLGAGKAAYDMQAQNRALALVLENEGVAGLKSMRASLVETIRTQGDATGAVGLQIAKIDELIGRTEAIPPTKTTDVKTETDEANRKLDEHNNKADHATRRRNTVIDVTLSPYAQDQLNRAGSALGFATGGLVPGSRFTPHLAVLHGGERVVSAAQLAAGQYSSSSGGGQISISVNVAAGTPPAEVGGAIVDAIRSYERTNGTAWRSVR